MTNTERTNKNNTKNNNINNGTFNTIVHVAVPPIVREDLSVSSKAILPEALAGVSVVASYCAVR